MTVRVLSNSFSTTIGEKGERFAGWLDNNKVVLEGNGKKRIVTIDGEELMVVDGEASIIAIGDSITEGSN